MRMFWWMDDDKVYDSLFSVVYTFIYIAQQAVSLRPKVSFFFICLFVSSRLYLEIFRCFFFVFFHLFFVLLRLVVDRSAMYLLFFLVFLWEYKASRDVSDSPFGHIGPVYMVRESTG